jgi:integrase/recombinase XerD
MMKQAKVLSEQELKRVLALVQQGRHGARNRVALMLSHFAGLRVGEIAQLRWSDVFAADGEPFEQIMLRPEITKGGVSRSVFVADKLQRELRKFSAQAWNPARPDAPLLRTQKRTPFSPNTLCQLFGELYRAAGVPGASSHSGRRWFITHLAHKGISPKVIMTLAGHKHLTTTQRYIDVNDEMMRSAVAVL